MSKYTEYFNKQIELLNPTEDSYEEILVEIASHFRDFGSALTSFIQNHGYIGDSCDIVEKARFLQEKYKESQIEDTPRDFKKWFQTGIKLDRKTIFPLIFALKLNIEDSADFFRRVQFERSFDCHTVAEAIYYFCIKNNYTYADAKNAINQIPKVKKIKAIPNREILYTNTIIEYLDEIRDLTDVIKYISENEKDFEYNNATAIEFIKDRWIQISGENGLAVKEGAIIDRMMNPLHPNMKKLPEKDTRSSEVVYQDVKREKALKVDDFITANSSASTWTIYAQIMGLDEYTENKYSDPKLRSLTPILKNNVLLPLRASDSFPSRQMIDGILRGTQGDYESYRKMLIFLVFYTYWAKRIVESNNAFYIASSSDSERCLDLINKYLSL